MTFYSPKNFKKGRHLWGVYRWQDISFLVVGALILVPSMIGTVTGGQLQLPLLVFYGLLFGCVLLLVQPFPPIYHNFMLYFYLQLLFLRRQKVYIWGGIVKYEEKKE
ncbi:hypothetical protein MKC73_01135 [[Clostridium] innocuum]|nr:hypothetical protein [[Clostridium] innocuum]